MSPSSLIKTSGLCLTKRHRPAGERSLRAPAEPAQEGEWSISPPRDLPFGRPFPPWQLWGELRGIGGQHPPPQTCSPGFLHPLFSKSAQIPLPLRPP